jgi:hypothetical protein
MLPCLRSTNVVLLLTLMYKAWQGSTAFNHDDEGDDEGDDEE